MEAIHQFERSRNHIYLIGDPHNHRDRHQNPISGSSWYKVMADHKVMADRASAVDNFIEMSGHVGFLINFKT